MNSSEIQSIAKRVIEIEAEAVSLIGDRIDENFELAVQAILNCTGRIIVSGMGKSGLISQKIASTMASTAAWYSGSFKSVIARSSSHLL